MKLVHESDIVVNFAAESHVDNSISSPVVFYETNLFECIQLIYLFNSRNVILAI